VLRACEACAAADGAVTVGETEVLRAVADTLAIARPPPLPPA
jgi:tellurite resistance protein